MPDTFTRTMNLYLIQNPEVVFPDDDNTRGATRDLIRYFRGSIPVRNIYEFASRVHLEAIAHKALIKKLIIGSHGSGIASGYGNFRIGSTPFYGDKDNTDEQRDLRTLGLVAPLLVKDADVYILACRTGWARDLLMQVSRALGGVKVHGYTDYITTTNYGVVVTLDDGTDDGMSEIVCLPGECTLSKTPGGYRQKLSEIVSR